MAGYDRKALVHKIFLRLATSPATLIPAVGGATAMAASWAFDLPGGVLFAGLLGLMFGAGTFLTRVALRSPKHAMTAFAEIEEEVRRDRERSLDDLEKRLAADADERDEKLLRDLRALTTAFTDESTWPENVGADGAVEIMARVHTVFANCVRSLEREVTLAEVASKMSVDKSREPIAAERERILGEVADSIEHLSQIFAELQRLRNSAGVDMELQRIREELDNSVKSAARVEKRMQRFELEQQ